MKKGTPYIIEGTSALQPDSVSYNPEFATPIISFSEYLDNNMSPRVVTYPLKRNLKNKIINALQNNLLIGDLWREERPQTQIAFDAKALSIATTAFFIVIFAGIMFGL